MRDINVYVKGVVYKNHGKGFALSAWAVKGEPVHYIEHEVNSAYRAEYTALRDAIDKKCNDDTILHIFSNQKAMIDSLNTHIKKLDEHDMPHCVATNCDFIWKPLSDSPIDLLRLRELAMREVEKRGKARCPAA